MTVVYSGGGTLGSVSPLLAVHGVFAEAAKIGESYRGIWIGLDLEKERLFVQGKGLEEHHIVSPRMRNFEGQGLSITMLTFPFRFFWACVQSIRILRAVRPDVHVSAGSFVSIPVAVACYLVGIPNVVHQQDLLPGLANRVMAKLAQKVTVAFEILRQGFGEKAVVTGNPVRTEVLGGDARRAVQVFGLNAALPTVFIIGGSSGAAGLNALVEQIAQRLSLSANVIHMTGVGERTREGNYLRVPFVGSELCDVYAVADVVVARAGLSTVTELGILGKAMILVPGPLHQKDNAQFFVREGAALMVEQGDGAEHLYDEVTMLLEVPSKAKELGLRAQRLFPKDAALRIAQAVSASVQARG